MQCSRACILEKNRLHSRSLQTAAPPTIDACRIRKRWETGCYTIALSGTWRRSTSAPTGRPNHATGIQAPLLSLEIHSAIEELPIQRTPDCSPGGRRRSSPSRPRFSGRRFCRDWSTGSSSAARSSKSGTSGHWARPSSSSIRRAPPTAGP